MSSTAASDDRDPIRFFFDYLSPYAYIAWTQIHALAERHGRAVAPHPVLFAALLGEHGQKGPAEIPAKRLYVFKDAYRKAHRFGLPPLTPPPTHPFNPLLALRVSALPTDALAKRRLIDAFFAATWAGGGGIDSPAKVASIAASAGFDGDALVAQASTEEAKARLRAATEEALGAGAFGVPSMVVGGELFWGVDSLPLLDDFLAGRDPLTPEELFRWVGVVPSATRRELR